jgi:hypothetical protein
MPTPVLIQAESRAVPLADLRDIARKRLGLTDLDAWQGKASAPTALSYADLPLFTPR